MQFSGFEQNYDGGPDNQTKIIREKKNTSTIAGRD